MQAREVYKQQQALGWTRIDLLLALYSTAIRDIDEALVANENGDSATAQAKRTHAMRVVLQLQTGLDFNYGDLPLKVAQLCEFVQHALLTGEEQRLQAARKVLVSLLEGFEGIRAEAIELESQRVIPPLEWVDTAGVTA